MLSQVNPENLTVNAVLIAMASVVGLALLLNCRTWWQVADSVFNSQRKRLHSAANNLHRLKSEGFMKVSFSCSNVEMLISFSTVFQCQKCSQNVFFLHYSKLRVTLFFLVARF